MRSRRRRKQSYNNNFFNEAFSLIILLIGIIGFGFGSVGVNIKKLFILLVGNLWFLFPFILIFIGFINAFVKEQILGTRKTVALILILLFSLTILHTSVYRASGGENLITHTHALYMEKVSDLEPNNYTSSGNRVINIGGGITGAVFFETFNYLFGVSGTIIISVVVIMFSAILLFDINIVKLFKKESYSKISGFLHREKRIDKTKVIKNIKEEKPEKLIISNINEIKNKQKITTFDSVKQSFSDIGLSNPYKLPNFDLLDEIKIQKQINKQEINFNKDILEGVIEDFGINAKVVKINSGPAVTQYEVVVPKGTKLNRVSGINKEIALALAAKDVRIEAPIPGKSTIGVEIPNKEIRTVQIREVLEETAHINEKNKLFVALGKDIMGSSILAELTKMPHLLVAGSTGSGKSVAINSIVASLMMRYTPEEIKLILIDPKKVELINYNEIPYLLAPVVTDPKKAASTLQKVVVEMESRYELFSAAGAKNLEAYNAMVERHNRKSEDKPKEKLPFIIVIIDELADLMLVASKEVEESIMRITQIARAAGIHLIVATQRPSTDVITGLIKNNIPSRIAFAVTSNVDSRTILDMGGAEKLLGRGDMLYLPMDENTPKRIQGCFISEVETNKLIEYSKGEKRVKYNEEFTNFDSVKSDRSAKNDEYEEPLYNEVLEFVINLNTVSTSLIQRNFRFGYNRAARVIDLLEKRGIVGPQNGSKPRDVLVQLDSEER